ncbi:MAG TPA: Asp-tRNA(Asn)/Glu-tRNA(Gln) amidotransferase subunit GatA [Phycisphaerales bacterium]|nr:Asp-tRNA(Asn)/Glu-tRNA(Gln) amidotransferase subunit GatA [Phycisphaerales bacterium]
MPAADPFQNWTATGLRAAILSKQLSAEDVTLESLRRIDALNPQLHAFLEVFHDRAIVRAKLLDARIARGENPGPLAGVPVAIKDNICLDFGKTTCASRILEHYESPFMATAAQRLLDAGAVIVGKTNLDEFAMGSTTENSAFGPSRNPWDPSRTPGGSSGGSAAAVAAGMVPIALGSDTGGSVRQPAAFCGVVGLKPTYGRVSRWGLVAFASSLDQIGPIATTAADAALALEVIAGPDPLDSTCSPRPAPRFNRDAPDATSAIKDLRLGVPREARNDQNHPAMAAAFERAIEAFAKLGATIVDIELPRLGLGVAAYYIVAPAEASSNLARFDGIRYGRRAAPSPAQDSGLKSQDALFDLYARSRAEGFGPEVQRRIMLGTYALSSGYYDAYYLTALKVRRLIKDDLDRAFTKCDAIITPSTIGPAFKLGEKSGDPLSLYVEDLYTVTANLAGIPAISIPAGFADEPSAPSGKLPVGVQLMGPAYGEAALLAISAAVSTAL